MRRAVLLVPLMATLLTSCGHSRAEAPPAATIAGSTITNEEVNQYTRYALSYFNVAAGGNCSGATSRCVTVRQEVLRRLMEERVVEGFAQQHRLRIGPGAASQLRLQLASLESPSTVTGRLLRRRVITRRFLRQLLLNEMMVRRVERFVTSRGPVREDAYQLRSVVIHIAPGGRGVKAYHKALDLATDGRPIPPKATVTLEWIRSTRLAANVLRSAAAAAPGQWIGPLRTPGAFLVIQVVNHRSHSFGTSTSLKAETRSFQHWLRSRLAGSGAVCYKPTGVRTACPFMSS